ncbi:polysaccharide biosynthesis protein [Paenibacillus septentrionalis]|uniref:Polysaccharide biosynthesis protein n=1 Tax=Paenibacillus septentrionalis TaxID=429342 RepID=A0ABW1V576_9BACL
MSKVRKNMILLMIIDCIIIAGCVALSFILYVNGNLLVISASSALTFGLFCLLISFVTFYFGSLYKRVWQFASVGEMILIFKAVTISMALAYILSLVWPNMHVPLSVAFNSYLLVMLGVGAVRFAIRVVKDHYVKQDLSGFKRTLIIGAGQCGVIVARELKTNANSNLLAIGFIDDDPLKLHQSVVGLPVLGNRSHIQEIVLQHEVSEIIIALPSASRREVSEVISICKKTNANMKIIPHINDLLEGKISMKSLRNVEVEDLLGRDPVVLESDGIKEYVEGKIVLVTGAGGSIGSELCRQLVSFNPGQLLLLGHGENSIYQIHRELSSTGIKLIPVIADVQDRGRMEDVFRKHQPQVVFHAAAHKHVPLMEENPSEAIKNNVFGTRNVADLADRYHTEKFVLVSTDKAVNPTSIMGTTKRIAEMYIQCLAKQSKTSFSAVRFGNVLGSRGSVIPLFKEQIAKGGPVTVTHPEMIRYFMTIPEASRLVLQAGAYATGGEIFILDMGEPVRIADLAHDLIKLSGLEPNVDIMIEYTGIRTGEKLYEELLLNEEGMTDTRHDRIFIGKPANFDRESIELELRRLERILGQDKEMIQELLSRIVPTYSGGKRETNKVLVPSS